ncbi:MAG: amidohydrolase [Desulfobacterales bacterium]|nr:amidohydrolase [Desulfobacterales bacterium]
MEKESVSDTERIADQVFFNGNIYTVNRKNIRAEAVVITDGRFVYVGDNETAKAFAGPNTKAYDLNGRMVLPGFTDSHAHPTMGVSLVAMAALYNLASVEACLDELIRFGEENPDVPVIYGIGWSLALGSAGGPKKEVIDAVISDRPVALWAEDCHAIWVNSKALEVCGITKDTPVPVGGVIERDPETGEPSGTFRENAMDLIANKLQPITIENMKRGLLAYAEQAAGEGITTVHDAMLLRPEMNGILMGFGLCKLNTRAFSALATDGELSLRVRGSIYVGPDMDVGQLEENVIESKRHQNSLFQIKSTKIFLDGVIEGHTGYMLEPYCDIPDYYGEINWQQDKLNEAVKILDQHGLQVHIHAISDGSVRMALDAFEYAIKANGKRDARHQITHLQLVSQDDYKRFSDMDIIGVPQPMWCKKWPYYNDLSVTYLGKERAEKQFPMKSLLDAGIKLAGGSDFPVCRPCPPLLGILGGVTRCEPGFTDPDEILGADERVSLPDMIECYTINGAYANFLENETGTIEVGKSADMVVLDQDLFEMPSSEIYKAEVLMTVFEGKIVYRNSDEYNKLQ